MEEFNFRHELFSKLHDKIEAFNADPTKTSTVGHNFMSTWTEQEKKKLTGYVANT